MVNLFHILYAGYHGEEVEDKDFAPGESPENQQEIATPQQEEIALKKLMASRQTHEYQLESFEKLKRSLADQELKRSQQQR